MSGKIHIPATQCRDFQRALGFEWLETNGRGGFASGTIAGPNTRRYHALLLVARRPPVDRVVLVNHVEEWVTVGEAHVPLSTNQYPGAVYPHGFRACEGFALDPWPTWIHDVAGLRITREILCVRGRDAVVIRWRLAGPTGASVKISVRPMLSGRDFHALHRENRDVRQGAEVVPGLVSWQPYGALPAVRAHHNGRYQHAADWFRRVQFPVEQSRGLDGEEDWWSPGEFEWSLSLDQSATVLFTTENGAFDVGELVEAERQRRERSTAAAPSGDPLLRQLWMATDHYVAERGPGQTVIAGYPWFADWGRDTFISLPGLCLATRRYDVGRAILETFAPHVSQGLIPNRFPDHGEDPEYNTIDGSLWFVHAVGCYWEATEDEGFVRRVAWPAIRQILHGYRTGARYGIRMASDGLITGGAPGAQLTWMDAKIGDWVVTPRHGKPVEIQALWVRALEVAAILAARFGDPGTAEECRTDAARVRTAFRARFWYEEGNYLYDVVDGPQGDDATLRPNQIFAISLAEGLVTREQARRILSVVRSRLLTPIGLRTLAPGHPDYHARYEGGVRERDGAYHQGTVWPFLLGPFVTAWVKTYGRRSAVLAEARGFLAGLRAHLGEAALGQVSEIFDAEPPHAPRGCVAQAWSIAEPLRALIEDLYIGAADAGRPSTVLGRSACAPASGANRAWRAV